jgi:beta-glucanase (GH16 family)
VAIDPNNLSGTATLTFNEDFNTFDLWNGTSGLDTRPGWAMWPSYDAGFSESGNGEQEWFIQPGYQPTASANPYSVQNGVLTITAEPTNPAISQYVGSYPYTSGWIDTYHEFSQTYGYFEMRAELPAGQGLWPAFWLLPENNSWPPELDVMEMIGSQPNELVTTVHSQVSGTTQVSSKNYYTSSAATEAGMTTGFHTYGVDWEPNTITWYFDGQEVFQTATPSDMNQPMYMIADLAVGGYWPGDPNSSTPFPAQMKIDYMRAYQADPASTTGGTGPGPGQSWAGDQQWHLRRLVEQQRRRARGLEHEWGAGGIYAAGHVSRQCRVGWRLLERCRDRRFQREWQL